MSCLDVASGVATQTANGPETTANGITKPATGRNGSYRDCTELEFERPVPFVSGAIVLNQQFDRKQDGGQLGVEGGSRQVVDSTKWSSFGAGAVGYFLTWAGSPG